MISKILKFLIRFPLFKKLHLLLLSVAVRSRFLSKVWYLFSSAFAREQQGVLAGIYSHKLSLNAKQSEGRLYTLRRNTHRIEKGLIMQPARDVFALDYIGQTVELFASLNAGDPDADQAATLGWSHDVLRSYFDVVDTNDPTIGKAQQVFENARNNGKPCDQGEPTQRPYRRELDAKIGIDVDQLHQLAILRRSCRWFLPKPIPRDLIDQAIVIGSLAPSACNRQPFEFRIFDDPDDAARIGAIPGGTAGFSHNFPCVVVMVGDLAAFPHERDRHLPYIDASLAAMGFLFALEVQGISSCCINWPDVEERESRMSKALNLSANQRVIMLIAIGYPDAEQKVPFSQKKPLDEVRTYSTNAS